MGESLYKRNIIEHYKNPKNFFKMEDFNKTASLSNITCGDELDVFLKVEGDIIKSISFQGRGCAISIAAMSILTEKVKGKKFNEIKKIKDEDILNTLGMDKETPRIKCALLGLEVLKKV